MNTPSTDAPTKFLIITRGRTGSNFLLSLLDSHPLIFHWGEIIGEWKMRNDDLKKEIIDLDPVRYIKQCYDVRHVKKHKKSRSHITAIGAKVLYHQFKPDYESKWAIPGLAKVFDFFKSNQDMKVIHIKRRNKLKTLVSEKLAHQTQQYTLKTEADRASEVVIELHKPQCNKVFNEISRLEKKYDRIFGQHDFLEVYYEDLVSDRVNMVHRILDFLQTPQEPLESKMLRQNTRTLPEVIKNYARLKDKFTDTPWASYFEE